MYQTLVKLGKAIDKGPLSNFLAKPKIKENKQLLILELVFDLPRKEVYLNFESPIEFSQNSIEEFYFFRPFSGNSTKSYVSTDKIAYLLTSLLECQFKSEIASKFPELKDTELGKIIYKICEAFTNIEVETIKENLERQINSYKKQNKNEQIVFYTASILEENQSMPKLLARMQGVDEFYTLKLLKSAKKRANSQHIKLCYLTGEKRPDISEYQNHNSRDTIMQMFVTTTINYASNLKKSNYLKNFQVSAEYNNYLFNAAKKLKEDFNVYIASVPHFIIPEVFSKSDFNVEKLKRFKIDVIDVVFSPRLEDIKRLNKKLRKQADLYWFYFLGYETDGTSFKTINLIPNVGSPYLIDIFNAFADVSNSFYQFLTEKSSLNFAVLYWYLPIKEQTKNETLELFSDILQEQQIDNRRVLEFFIRYLKIQRSKQKDSNGKHPHYNNITVYDDFIRGIENVIIYYTSLFLFLNKLNLSNFIKMADNTTVQLTDFDALFNSLNYTDVQKALFYLGAVVYEISEAQRKKGHENRPILNKLNYNGMDNRDIIDLFEELSEKIQQYRDKLYTKLVEDYMAQFVSLYPVNSKENLLKPDEALYFILSGFYFAKKIRTNNSKK